jgi:hypothetical protein
MTSETKTDRPANRRPSASAPLGVAAVSGAGLFIDAGTAQDAGPDATQDACAIPDVGLVATRDTGAAPDVGLEAAEDASRSAEASGGKLIMWPAAGRHRRRRRGRRPWLVRALPGDDDGGWVA